jgi:Transposase, Mutator family
MTTIAEQGAGMAPGAGDDGRVRSRPLDPVYAVLFIDVINVKIRDGNVANRPACVALAVTANGERDVLGLWAGEHGDGEGAKYWLRVLTEIKNRRAPHGRVPHRTRDGDQLRATARLVALLGNAAGDGTLASAVLIPNLVALAGAVGELREAEQHAAQAAAARKAAEHLHATVAQARPAAQAGRSRAPRRPGAGADTAPGDFLARLVPAAPVPDLRTSIGPSPWRTALVTSSLTMSSASPVCSAIPHPGSALRATSRARPTSTGSRPS